ncbi:MAG: hypothetical protein ACT443_10390 [Gemmatimonadota bacterium]
MKRSFVCDSESWLAWVSGGGGYGTGSRGLGNIDAIHFARAAAPDVPVFEALLAAGRFDGLFEEELVALFRTARRVVDPAELPERPITRKSLSG